MEVNNFDNLVCVFPRHVLINMCANGHSKKLSLLLSMKRLYKSSHIHNYKKLNLSLLGISISRKTYIKYVNQLIDLGLITVEGKGIRLIGINKILDLYPTTERIKFSYIENNKDLINTIKKIVLKTNIRTQSGTIRTNQRKRKNTQINTTTTLKTVRGLQGEYNSVLCNETSVTCLNVAKMFGYKSSRTGHRLEVKWETEGFIDRCQRKIFVGKLSQKIIAERRSNGEVLIGSSFNGYYQILANEITIRNGSFGTKTQPIVVMSYADYFGQF